MRIALLAIALGVFWMGLSGFFKPLLLIFGVLSVAASLYFAIRLNTADDEGVPLQIVPGFIAYLPWLAWEIVKSSWSVAEVIINPKLPISPTMVEVRATQKSDVGIAIYGNSITLTPGTVTVDLRGDRLTVHALVREGADALEEGTMDRRVTRLEGAA